MPTEIKLWQIDGERPVTISQEKLNLESRIEEWLRQDIGLVSDDLLVIGQQVSTDYGGSIDLLAIDSVGNLVILELKRDKTPRDIVAQVLDYASWVQGLGHEKIEEIANAFLKNNTFEQAFKDKFQTEIPDVLNERHRMYVVASSLDSATERIVKYLSETHDVDINVATFAYFKTTDGELLGRSLLLDETDVQTRAESKSKRKAPRSLEEFRGIAEQQGVLDLYNKALSELCPLFDGLNRSFSNVALIGYMGENKARNVIISIYPELSSSENGLLIINYENRLSKYFNLPEDKIQSLLGSAAKNAQTALAYNPDSIFFLDAQRLNNLIGLLKEAKQHDRSNKEMFNQSLKQTGRANATIERFYLHRSFPVSIVSQSAPSGSLALRWTSFSLYLTINMIL